MMAGAYRLYVNGAMVAMGPGRTNLGVADANNKVALEEILLESGLSSLVKC